MKLYRFHARSCLDFGKRTDYQADKCCCMLWAQGVPLPPGKIGNGGRTRGRRALGTNDPREAMDIVRRLEDTDGASKGTTREETRAMKTVAEAQVAFLADPTFSKLSQETRRKHRTVHNQLATFARQRRRHMLDELDADFVADFRNWYESEREDPRKGREGRKIKDGLRAANKKFERLRQFFDLACQRGWIAKNPTAGVELPKLKTETKDGLSAETMEQILMQAAEDIRSAPGYSRSNCLRAEALILFMRYSGLRISDAVGCRKTAVQNGRVRVVCQKNDKLIDNALPEYVTDTLAAIQAMSEGHWFWTGNGRLETATKHWQAHLAGLFERAGLRGITPHSFRHTFARAILGQPGKTLQDVADALGDTLTVVQRHYAGRSEERTARTNEAIRSTWTNDPTLKRAHAQKHGAHNVVAFAQRKG